MPRTSLLHHTEQAAVRRSTPTTGRTFCAPRSFTPGGTLVSSGQPHFWGPGIGVNVTATLAIKGRHSQSYATYEI
ncbi:hypothetical protein MRX96_048122 [Rhipicephalus microplus]